MSFECGDARSSLATTVVAGSFETAPAEAAARAESLGRTDETLSRIQFWLFAAGCVVGAAFNLYILWILAIKAVAALRIF